MRGYIAQGQLHASGRRFNGKRFVYHTWNNQGYLSPERTEIPPEAMADYDGPGLDGQIVRQNGADFDGWADVRLPADEVARLLLREAGAAVHGGPSCTFPEAFAAITEILTNEKMSKSEVLSRIKKRFPERGTRTQFEDAWREIPKELKIERGKKTSGKPQNQTSK